MYVGHYFCCRCENWFHGKNSITKATAARHMNKHICLSIIMVYCQLLSTDKVHIYKICTNLSPLETSMAGIKALSYSKIEP
jgi:hypothetical protein